MENPNIQTKTFIKKLTALLMVAVMLICVAPLSGIAELDFSAFTLSARALAETGECGDDITWNFDSSTGTLTISGTGEMADLIETTRFYTRNVSPFYQNTAIKHLVIEEGVTTVGSGAFCDCTGIESIVFPESLTLIGVKSFYGCDSLVDLTIGNGVKIIDELAFGQCEKLENITIGKSVETIGDSAFWNCSCLKSVAIPDNVTTIGEKSFAYCYDLESVIIGNGVTTIGYAAFCDCHRLSSLALGNSVESIGESAFYQCFKLEEITIPESVSHLGKKSLESRSGNITVMGRNVDVSSAGIDSNAIIRCYKDSSAHTYAVNSARAFVLIDGTDADNVFTGTVGKFDWNFDKRTGLLEINGSGALPDFGAAGIPWKAVNKNITAIKYSEGFTSVLEEHTDYVNLKEVTIPGTVIVISDGAFHNCTKLEKVTIGNGVTNIEKGAFYCCSQIKSVIIPDSVTSIGDQAFYGCGLEDITIGNGVTSIGYNAFQNCINLKNVKMGIRVSNVGTGAFSGCENLESLEIPYCAKSISSSAFHKNIKELIIYSKDCEINEKCGLNYTHTIYGFKGSTAEAFADKIGARFLDVETIHTVHTYVYFTTEKATCVSAKKIINKCICGKEEIKLEGNPLPHTEVTLKAVKPTYTKTGLTEGKKCSVCGKVLVKQKKVAKKKLKKVTLSSVKSSKAKTATVTWKKTTDASGYIVEYSTSKKFTKKTTKKVTIKKGKTVKTTLKKLKSGKKYYVRVKAYRTEGKKTVYGSYSTVKTVKVK